MRWFGATCQRSFGETWHRSVRGRVIPELCEYPGAEDDTKSWQGEVDAGVRVLIKKRCELGLELWVDLQRSGIAASDAVECSDTSHGHEPPNRGESAASAGPDRSPHAEGLGRLTMTPGIAGNLRAQGPSLDPDPRNRFAILNPTQCPPD